MRAVHGGDTYSKPAVFLDYSVNLNPFGMPDFVKEAARESLVDCARYPDSRYRALAGAAASYYDLEGERLIFGNGAAELIFRIVQARQPRRAVLLAPTFGEYEAALESVGVQPDFFCLKEEAGFELPVDAYLKFLDQIRPEIVFLCNPANPTGTVCESGGLGQILDFCGACGILAVVDECFLDFVEDSEDLSVLPRIRRGEKQIFVLKALTKSFAMAGLRFGLGFSADGELLERMRCSGQPWSVSIPAEAAAMAVFTDPKRSLQYLLKTRELLKEEKKCLGEGLAAAGGEIYGSRANFLFFCDTLGQRPLALYEHFLAQGILIRSCADYHGLNGLYYRVCVRRHEENVRFLKTLADYL
ncbi:MAG: aminotransferase class I/II-fold pyridoxal phosphate-dependent enzyme [Lachnospiraceae bacterium]|nr:aminotransferase class I/II-fold pyridoxal phosphate-dependent enzyme [Lachnospiraceae bacterium]